MYDRFVHVFILYVCGICVASIASAYICLLYVYGMCVAVASAYICLYMCMVYV